MFTGIVQIMGKVHAIELQPAGKRFLIDRQGWQPKVELRPGDSICVSGVCLTLVKVDDRVLGFDVIGETLGCTTLGLLTAGDRVNLEPSVTATTCMSGHFVQGHVEGVATVTQLKRQADDVRFTIEPPESLAPYIIPKGSIAIDGVSMTIAAQLPNCFEIALITTTLGVTTLGLVDVGSKVNLETDIISRTVVHTLENMQPLAAGEPVTRKLLEQTGFTIRQDQPTPTSRAVRSSC